MTLREARRLAGLTQVQLAKQLGVNQSAISDYEAGIRFPRLPKAVRIERLLGVPRGSIDWPENVAPRRPASGE